MTPFTLTIILTVLILTPCKASEGREGSETEQKLRPNINDSELNFPQLQANSNPTADIFDGYEALDGIEKNSNEYEKFSTVNNFDVEDKTSLTGEKSFATKSDGKRSTTSSGAENKSAIGEDPFLEESGGRILMTPLALLASDNDSVDFKDTAVESALTTSAEAELENSEGNNKNKVLMIERQDAFSSTTNPGDKTSETKSAYKHLVFSTLDFNRCFNSANDQEFDHWYLSSSGFSSGFFQYRTKVLPKRNQRRCRIALTASHAMAILFQVVDIYLPCRIGTGFLVMELEERVFNFCGIRVTDLPPKVYVISGKAVVDFLIPSIEEELLLQVNFTAIPYSARPQLEIQYTSATTGFIQSPEWNGHSMYSPSLNIGGHVEVPAGHAIMVSFLHLDLRLVLVNCWSDAVTLRKGNDSSQGTLQQVCSYKIPEPHIYNIEVLHVHLKTSENPSGTGFKMLFSFHPLSAVPQRLSNGEWNCSVPHWPDFRQHFPCNLVQDCSAGEDEENCPYFSPLCGPGYFSYSTSCYRYVQVNTPISWIEAASRCQLNGAHLVSLNDNAEWTFVTSLLRQHSAFSVHTGLHSASPSLPAIYRELYQWDDGSIGYLLQLQVLTKGIICSLTPRKDAPLLTIMNGLETTDCNIARRADYVCEKSIVFTEDFQRPEIHVLIERNSSLHPERETYNYVTCPSGHVTHNFLSCDVQSACWALDVRSVPLCKPPLTPHPPMFPCTNQIEAIPYSLVCDFRADCSDHSDEDFCIFPLCSSGSFSCKTQQDNEQLNILPITTVDSSDDLIDTPLPPGLVDFDGYGNVNITPINPGSHIKTLCPDTHFLCPNQLLFYCLPVYVRCNDVKDCPSHEDEVACDSYKCPGFYRCRASHTCLHPAHLCDGIFQCPQHDDELFCNAICPDACTCYGNAFFCSRPFPVHMYSELRFLEARASGVTPADVSNNTMLIHLSLASCGVCRLDLPSLPNLHSLDLTDNYLTHIDIDRLSGLKKLKSLTLSGNPLVLTSFQPENLLPSVLSLDLSRVPLQRLNTSNFAAFPNLQLFNLSGSSVEEILGSSFRSIFAQLQVLDVRGCPLTEYPSDVLQGLQHLQIVYADNYKLCCPATLPEGFNVNNCVAPSDEISSCEALLRSDAYRVVLVLFAALALLGNLGSFVFRIKLNIDSYSGFGVFVTHLCVSDFLMGVYLAVIGVADRLYQGSYLWKDAEWKHSSACKTAGFLSLLSSEVSAFIICLITLDRFLVLRFPFSSLHFHKGSAHLACIAVWCVGLVIAAVPLLPMTSHWDYYSQTGICIPLPITRKDFEGEEYSFSIIIVLNFVLFLLIALGQLVIYWSIRSNRMSPADSSRKSKDLTIARRLITVVMSDFLCWFPIGLLGLLAANGLAVPGEVNVAMAIIILPFNSALNPFLYTLNLILERRRRRREELYKKRLTTEMSRTESRTALSRSTKH